MPTALSERALCEIQRRCKSIRIAGEFETDAGLNVFRARRKIPVDRLPAVVVWDQGEQVTNGAGNHAAYTIALQVLVEIVVAADLDDTGHELEVAKADVKRAVLSGAAGALGDGPRGDKNSKIGTIAYTGSVASPRDEGAESESVALTFTVTYLEGQGNPYGAQQENSQ